MREFFIFMEDAYGVVV